MSDFNKNSILHSNDGQHTNSFYAETATHVEAFSALDSDSEADVCIIGGGYTGLSAALHLAEEGQKVILLEAEKVAWGASGRNGGHVGVGQRVGQDALEKKYGKVTADQLWALGLEASNLVSDIIIKHQIPCDLKHGILHLAAKAADVDYLKQNTENLRNNYDYEQVSFIEKDEVDQMVGSAKYFAGQLDKGSMHLHPLNYAIGLAEAARKMGATIFEQSRVTSYEKNSDAVVINSNSNQIKAKKLIIACNGYLDKLEPKLAGKIMPINNFVLATEPLSDDLAKQLIRDDVAIQDSLYVINYWKLSADNRLIFGGGENYTMKFPSNIEIFVRKYMLRVYPQLESTTIDYAWGGTLAVTMNRMPHYGQLSPEVYYAQGYSGHGVPTATMAGKLLAEAITGNPERFNQLANLPSPSFPGGTLLRWPGLVAGMLYHSLKDKL
ncbi:MAG: FAD-binding oxidoreductase [Gammaproteobacteria bacterium]|nr:FAD-binding oxidoreductase [Gammaproteobacteria bacterium]